jgi:hypothetical protein
MTRRAAGPPRLRRGRAIQGDAGSAGVEFALIAPVFLLILAGTFEIGLAIRAQFQLISVVTAAAHHALAIGDTVADGSAPQTAATIAALLVGAGRSGTVDLNNAIKADLAQDTVSVLESGADVSQCYCPSRSDSMLSWGTTVACGVPCDDGSVAGRFVEITAEVPFDAVLGAYGLFSDPTLRNTVVVRLP